MAGIRAGRNESAQPSAVAGIVLFALQRVTIEPSGPIARELWMLQRGAVLLMIFGVTPRLNPENRP
jgi:hypothetical protein